MDRHFAHCRAVYFCAVDGGLLNSDTIDNISINPIDDSILEMEQLNVDDILELIEHKGLAATSGEATGILSNVVAGFQQMNEPVYPSSVCLLLETLKQIPEFRPINRARLIDRYVECLLGRLEWEDVTEGTFSSTDKVNFLAYMAGEFVLNSVSYISTTHWKAMCQKYSAGKLLDLPKNMLEEFTQKGILISQNERITFRADYLFTYFVAKEMNINQTVYRYVTADDAFFRNYRELVFLW